MVPQTLRHHSLFSFEFPYHDFFSSVGCIELDAYDLMRRRGNILPHKISTDWQFAVSTVNEYR